MLYNIIDNMKKKGNIIQDLDLILDNIKEQLSNNFDLIDDFYFKFTKGHLDKDIIQDKCIVSFCIINKYLDKIIIV